MAYTFNGSTQYISANSSPLGNTPTSFSIAAWINGNSQANAQVVALGLSTSTTPIIVFGADGAGTGMRLLYRDDVGGSPHLITIFNFFPTTSFKHACFTTDNSTGRIYSNGTESASASKGSGGTTTLNRLAIGALSRTTVSQYFNGTIAEVGIWDVALTADEVASLADGMTCDKVRPQNLVTYIPLVRNIYDYTEALSLTNNNTATVAAHPRVYA